jgi:citrate lyase subunit beta / citryl-CoA lyase
VNWPLRTMLFIPAHKLDWVRKVGRYRPDSVVLDLEDAVPPALKKEACGVAREAIALLRDQGIAAFVRINAFGDGGVDDVPELATEGFSGVMLPKANDVEEIRLLDRLLCHAEGKAGLPLGSVAIMPLPETAPGIWAARDLAAASSRCRGIIGVVSGPVSGDVARAVGFRPSMEGSEQLYVSSKMVLDSRAGGAPYPMGSLIGTALDDLDSVRTLARRAKAFGYSGAVLIHPSHVAVAAEVFAPTAEEIDYYRGMIAAMRDAQARGDGAVNYRGMMVDYAMLPHAQEVVAEADRRAAAGTDR